MLLILGAQMSFFFSGVLLEMNLFFLLYHWFFRKGAESFFGRNLDSFRGANFVLFLREELCSINFRGTEFSLGVQIN